MRQLNQFSTAGIEQSLIGKLENLQSTNDLKFVVAKCEDLPY